MQGFGRAGHSRPEGCQLVVTHLRLLHVQLCMEVPGHLVLGALKERVIAHAKQLRVACLGFLRMLSSLLSLELGAFQWTSPAPDTLTEPLNPANPGLSAPT